MKASSVQRADGVGPGLDGVPGGVVLAGREPDGLLGEGDAAVVTGGVVAPELGRSRSRGGRSGRPRRPLQVEDRRSSPARTCQSIAAARAALSSTSAAFASKAAIVGDWSETLPTRLPSPSRKFTLAV